VISRSAVPNRRPKRPTPRRATRFTQALALAAGLCALPAPPAFDGYLSIDTPLLALGAARADSPADRAFAFAVRLMQQDNNDLAEEAFGDFIRTHPKDQRTGDAYYYLALLHRQRGDHLGANRNIDAVQDPLFVTPHALNLMRGQLKLEIDDPAGARAALEKVDPEKLPDADTQATWAYLLGVAYRGVGQQRLAADHFDIASEADSPVRGLALMELGKTRLTLDQPPAALEALTGAIEIGLGPAHLAEARSLAAALAYEEGQFGIAADLYDKILQYHNGAPAYQDAPMGLLRALYAANQDDLLVERFGALADRLPNIDRGEAMYLAAAAHVRQQRFKPALDILASFYQRYRAGHPISDEVFYLYAICFYQTDLDGFEKWLGAAVKDLDSSPHRHELMYLRAQAAVKRERFADAVDFLAPLIDEAPNPFARRSLLQRAALQEQLGLAQRAESDFADFAAGYGADPQADTAGRRAIDLAFSGQRFDNVVRLTSAWLGRPGLAPEAAAPVRFKLAVALIKLNRSEEALAQLEALLTQPITPPIKTLTHYYRGLLLAARVQPGDANANNDSTGAPIASLNAALKGELEDAYRTHALTLIARLHRTAGRVPSALETYQSLRQYMAVSDFEPLTTLWVGREHYHLGDFKTAQPWLSATIANTQTPPPAMAEALFLAGHCHLKLKTHDEAVETFTRLIAHSRGYGDQGRLGLAQAFAAAERVDEALDEYEGLINVEASRIAATAALESGLLYLERGRRYERAGDRAAAETLKLARKRLELVRIVYDVPELRLLSAQAMVTLAAIDADAGATAKARRTLDNVLTDPDKAAWHEVARAERFAAEGHRGDGVFLLRRVANGADAEPAASGYARQRLARWGETP
jgi:tetratricopeptide (TPR) repeat protein